MDGLCLILVAYDYHLHLAFYIVRYYFVRKK